MEIPQYDVEFNKEAEFEGLSDSSFEENAQSLLEGYTRFLPSLRAHQEDLDNKTPEELSAYNDKVARVLYGPRILDLFKGRQSEKITELAEVIRARFIQPKKEVLEAIDFDSLAMVLVRPEARFLTVAVKKFLEDKGCEIVSELPTFVNLRQYWMMYNAGFIKSDLADFPTRTLIYTHGESKIFILHKKDANLQRSLNTEVRGLAGRPSSTPTLRGTVILDGFEKAKREDEKLFYGSIDPLGMYRAITAGKISLSDPYSECGDPVLYYAGQGVHLPDDDELVTNTGMLLDNQQLGELARRFGR